MWIFENALCVRNEDDILVTEDGYEVLTKAAPKEALRYLKEPTM